MSGTIYYVSAAQDSILSIHSSGRYLVKNGSPWRIQAASAWSLPVGASISTIGTYFDNLQTYGFNSIYMQAIVHQSGFGYPANAPATLVDGYVPFSTAGNFSTPVENYWAFIDSIITAAKQRGIVVMLTPTYLGLGTNDGWMTEVGAQTQQVVADFGTYLGNRYKNATNLLWLGLGDNTPSGQSATNHLAMIAAIKAVASQPWLGEANGYSGGYAGNSSPALVADVGTDIANAIQMHSYYAYGQGYGDSYDKAYTCYTDSPTKPVWAQETLYEGENNTGVVTGAAWETLRSRFWSVLGGGTAGDGYGWHDHWRSLSLTTVPNGMIYAKNSFDLFASVPWWDMVPQPASGMGTSPAIVTSGRGTAHSGNNSGNWITASITSNGSHVLAYCPNTGTATRNFDVDASLMSGTYRARWWDPYTGSYTAIGTYSNTGTRTFTTPGANSTTSQNDWVLVLDVV